MPAAATAVPTTAAEAAMAPEAAATKATVTPAAAAREGRVLRAHQATREAQYRQSSDYAFH
jgi:hypothetical protein